MTKLKEFFSDVKNWVIVFLAGLSASLAGLFDQLMALFN